MLAAGHMLDILGVVLRAVRSKHPITDSFVESFYVRAVATVRADVAGDGSDDWLVKPVAAVVIAYLREQDFQLVGFMNPSFHPVTGAAVQSDLLFTASRL